MLLIIIPSLSTGKVSSFLWNYLNSDVNSPISSKCSCWVVFQFSVYQLLIWFSIADFKSSERLPQCAETHPIKAECKLLVMERGLSNGNTACPETKPKRLPNNPFQGICHYVMKALAPIYSSSLWMSLRKWEAEPLNQMSGWIICGWLLYKCNNVTWK